MINRVKKKVGLNPKNTLRQTLRRAYRRFLKIRGNPHEIALGFALGLFVGMTPVMGFHTAIAVFLAALFKWNKISAAVAVWISNPLTAPFVYGLTYFTGAKLMGLKKAIAISEGPNPTALYKLLYSTPDILWAMIIGGVVIGLPLAIGGYYFVYSAVLAYQEDIKRRLAISKKKLALKKELRRKKRAQAAAMARKKDRSVQGVEESDRQEPKT